MAHFSQFVVRLHNDPAFRAKFADSPAQALQEAGFDPTMFALPQKIDANELAHRLDAVFSGREKVVVNNADELKQLSADEIWKRFGVIGLAGDAKQLVPGGAEDSGDVTAVVVYGSSVAVSNSNVAVVTSGRNIGVQSVEQLQQLRKLSRLSKEQLTFSVLGPDGVAVHNLSADVLHAFVGRLK